MITEELMLICNPANLVDPTLAPDSNASKNIIGEETDVWSYQYQIDELWEYINPDSSSKLENRKF